LRADDATKRASKVITDAGGTVIHRDGDASNPVVAVNLSEVKLTDEVVKSLAAFEELVALDLSRTTGLTADRLAHVAALTELRILNLSHNTELTDRGIFKLSTLTNLYALNISKCEQLTDQSLSVIGESYLQLRVLDINGSKKFTATGLKELSALAKLETLNASNCNLKDADFQAIVKFTGLTYLNIAKNSQLTVTGLNGLALLTNLEVLDASDLPRMQIGNISKIAKLTSLHTLHLNNCKAIRDCNIQIITTKLTQLHTLSLAGCEHISDDAFDDLRKLPLRSLDVSGCENVTTAGMKELQNAIPELTITK
jgi:hypothetical protein